MLPYMMKELLREDQPLWMPRGSVRSILALAVVASFIAGLIPIEVATLVLGFYFAKGHTQQEERHNAD